MIKAIHIHKNEAAWYWPYISQYIENALEYATYRQYTLDDIRVQIEDGDIALFTVFDTEKKKAVGAYTVSFTQYPSRKVATINHLSADNLEYALATWDQLENYAKENGANLIVAWGRQGWKKPVAKLGLEQACVAYSKEI